MFIALYWFLSISSSELHGSVAWTWNPKGVISQEECTSISEFNCTIRKPSPLLLKARAFWSSFQPITILAAHMHTPTRCPIAQHHTIKDIEENNWSHGTNVRCRAPYSCSPENHKMNFFPYFICIFWGNFPSLPNSVWCRSLMVHVQLKVRVKLAEFSWHDLTFLALGAQYFDIWDTFRGNKRYWSVGYSELYISCKLPRVYFKGYAHQPAISVEINSHLKAMDEGAPKKPFPSEPLITLQYETSLYKVWV